MFCFKKMLSVSVPTVCHFKDLSVKLRWRKETSVCVLHLLSPNLVFFYYNFKDYGNTFEKGRVGQRRQEFEKRRTQPRWIKIPSMCAGTILHIYCTLLINIAMHIREHASSPSAILPLKVCSLLFHKLHTYIFCNVTVLYTVPVYCQKMFGFLVKDLQFTFIS